MILLNREPRLESRVKHIDVRYFLLRELQRHGQARLDFVASEANTAYVFTKALALGDHHRFCVQLGLVERRGGVYIPSSYLTHITPPLPRTHVPLPHTHAHFPHTHAPFPHSHVPLPHTHASFPPPMSLSPPPMSLSPHPCPFPPNPCHFPPHPCPFSPCPYVCLSLRMRGMGSVRS
ncbi:unnamed protein product [Closterium sp. Naga37s-1]|nr:unnamed protein product [Closterium sp. Naga37s-1]